MVLAGVAFAAAHCLLCAALHRPGQSPIGPISIPITAITCPPAHRVQQSSRTGLGQVHFSANCSWAKCVFSPKNGPVPGQPANSCEPVAQGSWKAHQRMPGGPFRSAIGRRRGTRDLQLDADGQQRRIAKCVSIGIQQLLRSGRRPQVPLGQRRQRIAVNDDVRRGQTGGRIDGKHHLHRPVATRIDGPSGLRIVRRQGRRRFATLTWDNDRRRPSPGRRGRLVDSAFSLHPRRRLRAVFEQETLLGARIGWRRWRPIATKQLRCANAAQKYA